MNVEPLTQEQLDQVNPGIRNTVKTLREWGYRTCDSGDGKTHDHACDLDVPYVHIIVSPEHLFSETNRLVEKLKDFGIEIQPYHPDEPNAQNLHSAYLPAHEAAFIHLYNIVLP